MREITYAAALDREKRSAAADKMQSCDWDAGRYLGWLLADGKLEEEFGEGSDALLLTENGELLAFCTYAMQDEIDDVSMTPWIGFVYTFPEHRGHRYSEVLVEFAKAEAKKRGASAVYVSSEEKGLYEKYGFRFLKNGESIHGYTTQIFVCDL